MLNSSDRMHVRPVGIGKPGLVDDVRESLLWLGAGHLRTPIFPPERVPPEPYPSFPDGSPDYEPTILPDNVEPHGPEQDPNEPKPRPRREDR